MFLSKYLTGCVSPFCTVSCNHAVDIYLIIPQVKPQSGLGWHFVFLHTNSKVIHHQVRTSLTLSHQKKLVSTELINVIPNYNGIDKTLKNFRGVC